MVAQRRQQPPARPAANARFFTALALLAAVGVIAIVYVMNQPKAVPVVAATPVDPATLGPAQGYLLGKPDAPVQILEFADFECPACGTFAVVTEPDVRKRIIDAGLASYRYFDYPLPMHKNTWYASEAAACANDQGKFWDMHDKLFQGQDQWNGEATSNPSSIFEGYAKDLGLDVSKWRACYDNQAHLRDIQANRAEGDRRKVAQTPTFVIGDRQIPGVIPYDQFKAIVDSAALPAKRVAAK
jgi:protein-disulfide isomerase